MNISTTKPHDRDWDQDCYRDQSLSPEMTRPWTNYWALKWPWPGPIMGPGPGPKTFSAQFYIKMWTVPLVYLCRTQGQRQELMAAHWHVRWNQGPAIKQVVIVTLICFLFHLAIFYWFLSWYSILQCSWYSLWILRVTNICHQFLL